MSRLEELIPDDLFEQFCDTFAPGDNASFRLALEELCISVRAEAQRESLEKAVDVAASLEKDYSNAAQKAKKKADHFALMDRSAGAFNAANAIRSLLPSEVKND